MNLFQQRGCMPTTYVLAALAKLGQQALDWDPLILRDAFQDQFDCKLSQKGFDKLQAGMTMVGTNLFNTSIQTFLACTAACANKPIKQGQLSYVSLKDCCWSIFCWRDLNGEDEQFDPDIVMYIQQLMSQDGISQLPDFMSFASLSDQRMTRIQEALVSDQTAFQAYTSRQLENVNDIKAYIKDKQQILVKQLQILDPIIHPKNS